LQTLQMTTICVELNCRGMVSSFARFPVEACLVGGTTRGERSSDKCSASASAGNGRKVIDHLFGNGSSNVTLVRLGQTIFPNNLEPPWPANGSQIIYHLKQKLKPMRIVQVQKRISRSNLGLWIRRASISNVVELFDEFKPYCSW
jgi:hypothetical protein